jgi:drug/metabolite transporter (DMT)-like permease
MAVVAGTVLFAEPPTPWLIVGVSLTIVGMILIEGKGEEAPV